MGGGSGKQAHRRGGGESAKRSFYGHKMGPKWCDFSRVRPKVYTSSSIPDCVSIVKMPIGYVLFLVVVVVEVEGVEIRPVAVGGSAKGPFLATK